MEKAVLFTNYSNEDFSHSWDSVKYDFPKGQQMMLEAGLAFHFAKHLAVRELNRINKNTNRLALEKEMEKALSSDNIVEAEDTTKLQMEVMNFNSMKKKDLVEVAKEKGVDVEGKKKAEIVEDLEQFEGSKE